MNSYFGIDARTRLQETTDAGLFRHAAVVEARQGTIISVDNKKLINFCSNDYLGLADHPDIISAMQDAASRYGVGSSASPLVCGKTSLHDKLEIELARRTGRDRALLFSCGYMANLAIVTGLTRSRHQQIFEDRLCHASMIDASILSRARVRRYPHADSAALERMLGRAGGELKLVLTESVFSMDGDIAPLVELARVSKQHDACLVVDDAHGFGVLGDDGLGALSHAGLDQDRAPLMMATFGKALGVYGAFVAGPDDLIESLVQYARPYIYTTSLPAPVVAAALQSLYVLQQEPYRRSHLEQLIKRFQSGLQERGLRQHHTNTAIQPLIVGDADRAITLNKLLLDEGIYVAAIRPPTVARNASRLRITLSAGHTAQQVDHLLDSLERVVPDIDGNNHRHA